MVLYPNDTGLMCFVSPEDETAPYQVVGGVTAHQAYNGYGP
jgi:hypothetical protein